MLKKLFVIGLLIVGTSLYGSSVMAGGTNPRTGLPYGSAGCGLGSLAFGADTGGWQILASTTNSTFGTQTFGITTGTSNCESALRGDSRRASLDNFVAANHVFLSNDAARGHGESLDSLAVVLGCNDSGTLGSTMKSNYGKIFPSAAVEPSEVSEAIVDTVLSDATLSKQCGQRV